MKYSILFLIVLFLTGCFQSPTRPEAIPDDTVKDTVIDKVDTINGIIINCIKYVDATVFDEKDTRDTVFNKDTLIVSYYNIMEYVDTVIKLDTLLITQRDSLHEYQERYFLDGGPNIDTMLNYQTAFCKLYQYGRITFGVSFPTSNNIKEKELQKWMVIVPNVRPAIYYDEFSVKWEVYYDTLYHNGTDTSLLLMNAYVRGDIDIMVKYYHDGVYNKEQKLYIHNSDESLDTSLTFVTGINSHKKQFKQMLEDTADIVNILDSGAVMIESKAYDNMIAKGFSVDECVEKDVFPFKQYKHMYLVERISTVDTFFVSAN